MRMFFSCNSTPPLHTTQQSPQARSHIGYFGRVLIKQDMNGKAMEQNITSNICNGKT
jgi:hypothetical protein